MAALTDLLAASSIILDAVAADRDDAVGQAGAALLAAGAVDAEYTAAMLEREQTVSTYVGEGVAVPHGTLASESNVHDDALVLLRFADAIDWNGNDVNVVIGLAARGRGHVGLLSQLAAVLLEPERAAALRDATSTDDVYRALSQ
ncbi:hypothetical protein GCM10027413_18340 [Conyzicola nivalis]|uniref:Mannitol-specific phosphotransferase enzyme IIA component n=1 Tax=Conyzicola nivalis TaxID=1477021 RepID=A0A916WG53_9MICO|nr:PTS sugar transporter subunit IIA [Conyzicola nivalis]GGA96148.1 hypothetical protein GCM10010979_08280 [Conyzicola nivalis]